MFKLILLIVRYLLQANDEFRLLYGTNEIGIRYLAEIMKPCERRQLLYAIVRTVSFKMGKMNSDFVQPTQHIKHAMVYLVEEHHPGTLLHHTCKLHRHPTGYIEIILTPLLDLIYMS